MTCDCSWRPSLIAAIFIALMNAAPDGAADAFEDHDQIDEVPISESDRTHWAFRTIDRPAVPETVVSDAVVGPELHPIDALIAQRLSEEGLVLQPRAPQQVLVRRLWFDVLGLPPSPDELQQAELQADAAKWHVLVDELLARPEYGERWAQHWLDAARFAETDGYEHDLVRPDAWKFRDWVIDALNADMPYDEFLRLQLAGDEIRPDDPAAATATMFCLSGPDMPDINSQDERRHTLLNELTATVGSVVLGVQLGCAQCHDHKYDPISQADFYRIRAVFEPAVQVKKNKSVSQLHETDSGVAPAYLWVRGDHRRRGPMLDPGVLRVASSGESRFRPAEVAGSSGRRTAFADWVVSRSNPLTSRVIVNRIWQHHFGTGMCDTPGDFGYIGSSPSHEDLLNWLAVELMETGWSLKSLHRLILTSAVWQQRSHLPADATDKDVREWGLALEADPYCRLLSRFPRRRLEGEAIRDAMLSAAGVLNAKRGGPGVMPPLPPELQATLLKKQWEATEDPDEHFRRSIYVFARRNLRYPAFDVFDRPDPNTSCAVRMVSTTAPQSLYLLNSEFSHDIARRLGTLLAAEHAEAPELVEAAFLRLLSRRPDEAERTACLRLLDEAMFSSQPDIAAAELSLVLLNTNEFIYPD